MAAPTCPTISQPSRSKRTVVLLAPESSPGCQRTAGLQQILLYEQENPVQPEFETIRLNRLRNGLAPEGFAIGVGTYNQSGTIYMAPTGIPNIAPAWSLLLRACGWQQTRYTKSTDTTTPGTVAVTAPASGDAGELDVAGGTYKYKAAYIPATRSSGLGETLPVSITASYIAPNAGKGYLKLDFSSGGAGFKAADAIVRLYRTKTSASSSTTYYYVGEVLVNAGGTDFSRVLIGGSDSKGLKVDTGYVIEDRTADINLAELEPTSTAGDGYVEWIPVNEGHDSLTVHNYLDFRMFPATGVRGTIAFSGDSGQPFKGDFTGRGVYNESSGVNNPDVLATPLFPPRLLNAGVRIMTSGDAVIYGVLGGTDTRWTSPHTVTDNLIVKNINMNLGVDPQRRNDMNQTSGVIEYAILDQYQPRITINVEADKQTTAGSRQDWLDHFVDGLKYQIEYVVAPSGIATAAGTGQRFDITAGADPAGGNSYGCQLVEAPQLVTVDGGVRCWQLVFEPSETDTGVAGASLGFLKIRQS